MTNTEKIRALNDEFRKTMRGGKVVATQGVMALPDLMTVLDRVREFSDFTEENNPHGENDFGAFIHNDQHLLWKIDAYDKDLRFGSPDPTDPTVTVLVLTILLAEEH